MRNIRRDGNDAIKKAMKDKKITEDDEKRAMDEIQKLTDDEIKKMEEMSKGKEKEVMEIYDRAWPSLFPERPAWVGSDRRIARFDVSSVVLAVTTWGLRWNQSRRTGQGSR